MAPAEYSSSCANSVSANPVGQSLRVREPGLERTENEREEPPPTPLLRRLPRGKLISLDSASAAPSRSIEVGASCTTRAWPALTRPWLTPPPCGVDRLGSPGSPAPRPPDMRGGPRIRAYPQHGLPCRRRVVCVLTILDGSTFVVSDDIGDVGLGAEGVFADDTRMLSRCRLLLDGESPLLLTSRAVDYFSATHYLRNAPTPRIPADTVSIGRERFVGSTRDRAPHPQQREHVGAVVRRRSRARRRLRGHHLRQGTRLRVRRSRVGGAAAGRAEPAPRSRVRRSRSRTTRATERRFASPRRPS